MNTRRNTRSWLAGWLSYSGPKPILFPALPPNDVYTDPPQLVLLAMCDHYQRVVAEAARRATAPTSGTAADAPQSVASLGPKRAVGILFGVQHGLTAEVFTSFEMMLKPVAPGGSGGAFAVDEHFLSEQRSLGEGRRRGGCTSLAFHTWRVLNERRSGIGVAP